MALPSISVINFSPKEDQEVQDAIRAVNRQIAEDFAPIWGAGRELILHASSFEPGHPDQLIEEPVRADGVLYLITEATLPDALGYHDMNAAEIPVGFVFTTNADWTVTLSHEALEMILDPTVNIFVPGPDPRDSDRLLWHTYEVCDAVERTSYEIDGIRVSNFLTPNYFREGNAPGTRNDFLGVGVSSFGLTTGSHLGVYNPQTGEFELILGHLERATAAQQRRMHAFERPKPARPSDEALLSVLSAYRKKAKGLKPLALLGGITRTSRYRAACKRLLRARARIPELRPVRTGAAKGKIPARSIGTKAAAPAAV